jgi:signal transduction histidine kinase
MLTRVKLFPEVDIYLISNNVSRILQSRIFRIMTRCFIIMASALMFSFAWNVVSLASVSEADLALAMESEIYCTSTAETPPTAKLIMDKVNQAAELLNKEGSRAYAKFKGKKSEFIFNGTYIWVHGEDGTMLMHPIKPGIIGQNVLKIKDFHGKKFFQAMNDLVEKHGSGWVEYTWPKPGKFVSSVKVSYVRGATVDGTKVVVGCGVYDLTLKNVEGALKAKAVDEAPAK